jgi:hypothetical protein
MHLTMRSRVEYDVGQDADACRMRTWRHALHGLHVRLGAAGVPPDGGDSAADSELLQRIRKDFIAGLPEFRPSNR